MIRLREVVRDLDALRAAIEAGRDARSAPAFSIVLIGPMLWTRFEQREGALVMTEHAQGPSRDDVVVVTDGPVVEALVAGRFDVQTAQARGLLRYYGAREAVAEVVALFRRASPAASGAAVRLGTRPRGPTVSGEGPS